MELLYDTEFNMLCNHLICSIITFSLITPVVKCDSYQVIQDIIFNTLPHCDKHEHCYDVPWIARRKCGVIDDSDQGNYFLRESDNCYCCNAKQNKILCMLRGLCGKFT